MKARFVYFGASWLALGLVLWLACGERIGGDEQLSQGGMEVGDHEAQAAFCCNRHFPSEEQPPGALAGMLCGAGPEYTITCETCARYWSAYGDNPTEMCQYLPGEPPLPDVPVPGDFSVHVTGGHPQIGWARYYVHEYSIERKMGTGGWTVVASLTSHETESWTDYSVTVPDPKGRAIWYRMRGRVYGAYSCYTEELQALPEEERVLP